VHHLDVGKPCGLDCEQTEALDLEICEMCGLRNNLEEGGSHPHGHIGPIFIVGGLERFTPHIKEGVGDLVSVHVGKLEPLVPAPSDPQIEDVLPSLARDFGSCRHELGRAHPPALVRILEVAPVEVVTAISQVLNNRA